MDAIKTLMDEHRVIEGVLDALDTYASRVARAGSVNEGDLERFTAFIREFADACHHGKEEDILFAALVESGFPADAGPIPAMRDEHQEGRRWVQMLDEISRRAGPWTEDDRRRLVRAARSYTGLLRRHIHKEDHGLFPMVRARLSPEALRRVEEQFEAFEQRQTGRDEHERLHRLAEDMMDRYGPPRWIPRAQASHDVPPH